MSDAVLKVRRLSKQYRLGTIGRHTLADEWSFLWHKLRRRDPRARLGPVGLAAPSSSSAVRAGPFWALKDVSFDVHPGEVVGVIGSNGAGKSTLLKILTRITEPTAGEAEILGRVASLLEVGTGFHPELTGRENIYMNGAILGMKIREIDSKIDDIIAFSEIGPFMDTPVKRYSSGMYVRLAFAVAAHLVSDILLVDEVLAVGDASFQNKCIGKMSDLAGEGRTVLFISHNLQAVSRLCSRGIVLAEGRVAFMGGIEEAVAHYFDSGSVLGMAAVPEDTGKDWQIRRVRLGDGQQTCFRSSSVLNVRIECVVRRPARGAQLGFECRNRLNECLFATTPHDQGPTQEEEMLSPGTYEWVCEIPLAPFRAGRYALNLSVAIPGVRWIDRFAPQVLFDVQDDYSPVYRQGRQRPGHILPIYPWHVQKIS